MQKLGLTTKERRAFHDALRSSHTRRVLVEVTDLNGDTIASVNNRVLDGQVTVDYRADVTRALNLTLLDPTYSLNFDSDSPDDGAVFADRMIRVTLSYDVPDLDDRVNVPVFLGPVTKLSRSGQVVEIEAQGKESLALGAIWHPTTLKKGMQKVDAIRTLLRRRAGETRFSIPDVGGRLPKTISLNRYDSPWHASRKIARGMDRHLFYDGAGVATLRHLPQKPVWTFREGTGGDVVGAVEVSYEMSNVKNVVIVVGGKPKGAKKRVRAQAVAERSHALSPQRLGRFVGRGENRERIERRLVEVINDDSIRSESEAERKARRVLNDRLRATVEVSFDALPIPHLDPGDLVAVQTDDVTVEFRLKQFVIPLGVSGAPSMSVGYLKNVRPKRRRIRR